MKLSVALCTYNGESYLPAQLDSIAAQIRLPDELIVCDDCSGDETRELLKTFAAGAAFPVRVHFNEENLGCVGNFAKAIGLCEGDAIVLCDQDDVWSPGKLERMEQALAPPEVGMVFSDAELVDEQLRPTGCRLWQYTFKEEQRKKFRAAGALAVLLEDEVVTGATMAFRADLKRHILPVPEGINRIHDGWIALVAAAMSRVVYIDEPLIGYRQHARQQLGVAVLARPPVRPLRSNRTHLSSLRAAIETCEAEERTFRKLAARLEIGNESDELRRSLAHIGVRVKALQDQIDHLRERVRIAGADGVPHRASNVLRELATRRYHRYSKGFPSALKDVLGA